MIKEAFFHGHDHVTETEDGYTIPYRMTPARLTYYAAEDEIFTPRAQNSSGISLAFETAADMFTFSVKTSNEVRNENSFTVYENGRLVQIIGFTWDEAKSTFIYRKKSEQQLGKRCTYEIYLPTMATVGIKDFAIADATPLPKHEKQLLALGDSITHGVYAQASAHAYPTALARRFGLEVCNQAVGGYYFNPEAIEPEAAPSIITLAFGINDISRMITQGVEGAAATAYIAQQAERCLQKIAACYPAVPVVAITPLWRADFTAKQLEIYQALTPALLALYEKYSVHAINGAATFPHDAALFTDGFLHPNDDGFAIMTNLFAAKIAKLL